MKKLVLQKAWRLALTVFLLCMLPGCGRSGARDAAGSAGEGIAGDAAGSAGEGIAGDAAGSAGEGIAGDAAGSAGGETAGGMTDGKEKGWEKHIVEETIYIEGLEQEYTLLFLTDTHVIIPDAGASEEILENEAARSPMFVNGEGIPSAEQFPEWIRYANEVKADAVVLGGDIIDTPSASNLEWLKSQLAGLEMPYLYVNGNHDWTYPWEYMTQTGRETYLPLLEPLMQGNTAIHSLELGELSIVGIDDSSNQVDGEVLEEYERLLQAGKPVIVAAHVPFMTQSVLGRAREVWTSPVVIGAGNFGGIYPNEESERFVALTTASSSPVELVLAGHVHFYDDDVIEGEKSVRQITGGAGFQGEALLLHVTGSR